MLDFLDDRLLSINPFSDICSKCKHWAGGIAEPQRCKAFGDKPIPDFIWEGRNPHTSPVEGDNGILFEEATLDDLKKTQL